MIHSPAAVQTENFDAPASPPQPPPPPTRRGFPLPAEYYSTPPGDRRPLVAPWVPVGCGTVSIVLLAAVFTGGYFAAHGGALSLMQWLISRTRSEITPMFAKDVTAAQKAEFDRQMSALEKNLRAKRVGLEAMQPVLRDMRDAMLDSTVTPEETQKLITDLRAANSGTKPK
jgi:hypothetical protein